MFSELKSLPSMGLSNSEMFFSDHKDLNPMEFNFLVRSTLQLGDDCEIVPQGLCQEKEVEEEEKQEDKCETSVPALKIKLPPVQAFQIEEDSDDDGFKTPTSLDRKIPVIFQCPPAPRKPKSLPSTKRKSPGRRVLLDLSNEIGSLFPSALEADLSGKIKKARQGNDTK